MTTKSIENSSGIIFSSRASINLNSTQIFHNQKNLSQNDLETLFSLMDTWNNYVKCENRKEKERFLLQFLSIFVHFFKGSYNLNEFSFINLEEINSHVTLDFVKKIENKIENTLKTNENANPITSVYEFLLDEGLFHLLAIKSLTTFRNHSVHKLASLIVILVSKILSLPSNILVANSFKHGGVFKETNYHFNHIGSYFNLPTIPAIFKPLFSSQSSSSSTFSARAGLKLSDEKGSFSVCGDLCFHLLATLSNLLKDPQTLEELVSTNKLSILFEILSLSTHVSDFGLLIIHKQLVRTLCQLASISCVTITKIAQIKKQNFFVYLLTILGQRHNLSSIITLELCQMIVYTLKKSISISFTLFDEFEQYNGYQILKDNLITVSKFGTKYERLQFISTICHLLFIGKTSKDPLCIFFFHFNDYNSINSYQKKLAPPNIINNVQAFKILLDVFENSDSNSDIKIEILDTIRAIFLFDTSTASPQLDNLGSFKILFHQFDFLSIENKRSILEMMDEMLNKGELTLQELESYCSLLIVGKNPSTVILIANHIINALKEKQITKNQIRKAGIGHILTEFMAFKSGPYNSLNLSDKEEIKSALLLLAKSELKLGYEPTILKNLSSSEYDEESNVSAVIYGIAIIMFELCIEFVTNSPENQQYICENGLKQVYRSLFDDKLRRIILQLLSILAVGENSSSLKIIPEFIQILISCGGTASINSEDLEIRRDILTTMCYIFEKNENTKTSFGSVGFIWSVSVLEGITKQGQTLENEIDNIENSDNSDLSNSVTIPANEDSSNSITSKNNESVVAPSANDDLSASSYRQEKYNSEDVFAFLKTLLYTLSLVLTGVPSNQSYFKEHIGFSTISTILQCCHFIEGPRVVELCDSILNMAVKYTWPASCPKHVLPRHIPPWETSSFSSQIDQQTDNYSPLNISRSLISTCFACKQSLHIENPEVFKLIIQLLGKAIRTVKNSSSSLNDSYVSVINNLSFLADLTSSNQTKLSSISLVGTIIENFHHVLLTQNKLQASVLDLIYRIANNHISLSEIFQYLSLIKENILDFPINLIEILSKMAIQSNVPTYYANFSPKNALSYIDMPSLGDRLWPPSKGFSMSFWFHIEEMEEKNKNNPGVCLFSFESNKTIKLEIWLTGAGTLKLYNGTNEPLDFADCVFEKGKWYHIVMAHGNSKTPKKIVAKLFVNGIFKQSGFLSSPKSVQGKVTVRVGTSFLTTTPKSDTLSWQLGNVFFFEDVPTDKEVFLLYNTLGPNYAGGFESEIPLEIISMTIKPSTIRLYEEFGIKDNLSYLKDKIVFVLSVRNMVLAQALKIPFFPSGTPNTPSVTKTLAPSYARMFSSIKSSSSVTLNSPLSSVCTRISIKNAISYAGGLSVVIYLIALLQRKEYQQRVIRLLYHLTHGDSKNLLEMKQISGYELLAHLLRKNHTILDESMLELLFRFVGLKKAKNSYSNGVISNIYAFQALLLDWKVWEQSDLQIKKILYESLADLVSVHQHAKFNIKRFRECGVMKILLNMFQEYNLPYQLNSYFITILKSIVNDPPNQSDLKDILDYLIITHQTPKVFQHSTLRRVFSFEDKNEFLKREEKSIRIFVLDMLLDILSKDYEFILDIFNSICSIETLFVLLRTDSSAIQIRLLKILDLILHSPSNMIVFEEVKGFALLGTALISAPVSNQVFGILFSMLLGKPANKYPETDQPIGNYFISSNISPVHPAAINPILILLRGEPTTDEMRLPVVKTLYFLFLQSDSVKEAFLSNQLIDLLCDLFLSELEKKAARSSSQNFSWSIEETLLAFLKAISLHGFMNINIGIGLLADIFAALELVNSLPIGYFKAIRRRILFDVLQFFNENDFMNNNALVSAFKNLYILICNYLCWTEDEEEPPSTPLDSSSFDWRKFPGIKTEKDLIELCFSSLIQFRQRISSSNNLVYFSVQHSVQIQFGKLILYLLKTPSKKIHVTWLINQLVKTSEILNDFISTEEFIVRLIIYSHPLLASEEFKNDVWKLWQIVLKSNKDLLKTIFVIQSKFTFEKIEAFNFAVVQSQISVDITKAEENDASAQKSWDSEKLALKEKKQTLRSKNQDLLKSKNQLMMNNIISIQALLKTKYETQAMQQKMEKEKFIRKQWKLLTKKVTHERGIWSFSEIHRWKLDPTEGPNRMRIRLKPIVPPQGFLTPQRRSLVLQKQASTDGLISPEFISKLRSELLSNKEEETVEVSLIHPGERILSYYKCARITPFITRDGEIAMGEERMYFIEDTLNQKKKLSNPKNIMWNYTDIREIHKRRYLLKSNAMEIFLINGKTYLLAFEHERERNIVYDQLSSMELPNKVSYEGENIKAITKKWKKGLISNFEYLMHLNTLAGRSLNDLTQYPIFPFILADYSSEELDLTNSASFRDLSKPMGSQDPKRFERFEKQYYQIKEMEETPYFYGSHYSNLGSVLHYLVRLEPFSHYFIDFQGGRFDVPDRAFHSMQQTWLLSSSLSSSDVKELIPEFFYLPDFLENSNRFDMGVKQNGERVDHIILPSWAKGSARLFIRKHYEALECNYVSERLHHWIDLIFGYKQTGEEAFQAKNLFHPLTYEGAVDIDSITDPVLKEANIAQISSYGQVPKQLFKKAHPVKNISSLNQLMNETILIHPERLSAYPLWSTQNSSAIGYIALLDEYPSPIGLNKVPIYPGIHQIISWGHWDQSLRICALDSGKVLSIIETGNEGDILCGDVPTNGQVFVSGGSNCVLHVWKRTTRFLSKSAAKTTPEQFTLYSSLYGHTDAVLCVKISQAWSIIASGSEDKTCILWDLNQLSYIRTLKHENPVSLLDISPVNGDIVTVEQLKNKFTVRLFSINGVQLATTQSAGRILCIKMTHGQGQAFYSNFVIGGLETGVIQLWSAWNLAPVYQLEKMHQSPITALAVSSDLTQIFSGDESGLLVGWSKKPRDMMPMGI